MRCKSPPARDSGSGASRPAIVSLLNLGPGGTPAGNAAGRRMQLPPPHTPRQWNARPHSPNLSTAHLEKSRKDQSKPTGRPQSAEHFARMRKAFAEVVRVQTEQRSAE